MTPKTMTFVPEPMETKRNNRKHLSLRKPQGSRTALVAFKKAGKRKGKK